MQAFWHFGIFAKKSNKKSTPIFPIFRLFPTFRLSFSTALIMTVWVSDLQSDSDLDSVRKSCDVFETSCIFFMYCENKLEEF